MTSHEQRKWLLKLFLGSIHHSFLGKMPGNNFHGLGFVFFFPTPLSHLEVWMKGTHIDKKGEENPFECARLSVM